MNYIMAAIVSGCVALCGMVIYASIKDAQEWDAFKAAHACKVVAYTRGQTFTTTSIDTKGNLVTGVGSTPDQTSWLCNDGVVYTR